MSQEFQIKLGQKVSDLRKKKGLSSERLAYSVELSKQALINLEQGTKDPRLSTLLKVSEGLGISISKLLAG
jgi:transcriptional regulator with XRE-family HTH domain